MSGGFMSDTNGFMAGANSESFSTVTTTGDATIGGQILAADGTNAAPSISFANDSDVGFYSYDTNAVGLALAGVARFAFYASTFAPAVNNFTDLGTSSLGWKDLFLTGDVYLDTGNKIYIAADANSDSYIDLYNQDGLRTYFGGNLNMTWTNGSIATHQQFRTNHGSDVASAASIALAANGSGGTITGTNTIESITSWGAGNRVMIDFAAAATIAHAAGSGTDVYLAAGTDYTFAAGDCLFLVCDGTNWREPVRTDKVYGEIYVSDPATPSTQVTNGSADTFDVVTGFANDGADGESRGTTVASASNKITLDAAGKYRISFSCSFTGTASQEYTCTAYIGGSAVTGCSFIRKLSAGNDVGSASFEGIGTATAGQDLDVRVACDGTSKNFIPQYMNLTATRLDS